MITALQQFIDETMKKESAGALRQFEYEDMRIAIERGKRFYLAVFLKGNVTHSLRTRMQEVLAAIGKKYEKPLLDWDGTMDEIAGMDAELAHLGGPTGTKVDDQAAHPGRYESPVTGEGGPAVKEEE
jgi:hypothetical protein